MTISYQGRDKLTPKELWDAKKKKKPFIHEACFLFSKSLYETAGLMLELLRAFTSILDSLLLLGPCNALMHPHPRLSQKWSTIISEMNMQLLMFVFYTKIIIKLMQTNISLIAQALCMLFVLVVQICYLSTKEKANVSSQYLVLDSLFVKVYA